MSKMSRNKGKRGELEFAAFLKSFGVEAARGVQHRGGENSPDVIHSIPGVHFEVKRVEQLRLLPSLDQATKDAGSKTPVVAWRRNNGEWIAILRASDLMALLPSDQEDVEDLL